MFSGENPIRPSISSLAVNPLFRSANTRTDKNGAESIRFALTSFRANDSNILYIHIYIYRLVEDISTRYNLATKGWDEEREKERGGEKKIFEYRRVRVSSKDRFFSPLKNLYDVMRPLRYSYCKFQGRRRCAG